METTATIEPALDINDEVVINKVLHGETKQFELLIKKYNARMYRIGMVIINNDTEIEDVMQNAYIKAFQGLPKFENRSTFGTWLTRILVNECLQFLKKSKRTTSIESANFAHMYKEGNGLAEQKAPDSLALNKELRRALEESILELPEKYRMVFVMREMEQMTTTETVQALEISEANVKVRLNRAKSMLRDKLNNYYRSDFLFHFYLTRCKRVTDSVMNKILV